MSLNYFRSLFSYTFGFKRKHSTDLCIFTVKNVTKYYTQENSSAFTCFLDASKAFDKINHYTLFRKLLDRKTPIMLVRNFLKKRKQCVVVDGVSSGLVDVDSGVPQGTVLGPILFLLHINDLPSIVSSKVRLFADDCLIYRQIRSNNDQIELQRDLNLLES